MTCLMLLWERGENRLPIGWCTRDLHFFSAQPEVQKLSPFVQRANSYCIGNFSGLKFCETKRLIAQCQATSFKRRGHFAHNFGAVTLLGVVVVEQLTSEGLNAEWVSARKKGQWPYNVIVSVLIPVPGMRLKRCQDLDFGYKHRI